MKRSLILLSLLLTVACKNTNSTMGAKKMPFEHEAFLTIPHAEDHSILRRKLLNMGLTKKLNIASESKLADGDEFLFTDDPFIFGDNELIEYKKYKASCAEIIVSFRDHLDIYFVPTGITKNNALSQLNLQGESGNKFFWVTETPTILSKGQTYYVMNTSDEEIKINDVNFHHENIQLNQNNVQSLTFTNNQKIIIDIKVDYLMKETAITSRSGNAITRCTRDMNEAGLCGGCDYKIEDVTGRLVKKNWSKSDLGLVFKLNDQDFPLEKFDSTVSEDGHLIVTVDLRKITDSVFIKFQVLPWDIKKTVRTVKGFDFSPSCRSHEVSLEQDLTPVIQSSGTIDIKGRVLYF